MKVVPLLLLPVMLITLIPLPAAAQKPFSIAWGKGEGELGFYRGDDDAEGQDAPAGPPSFAVDAEGNLYLADTWNRRIKKFSISGRFIEAVGADAAPFGMIGDLAVAADRSILFVDEENQEIVRLGADGRPALRFGGQGEEPGKFAQLGQIAVAPDGTVAAGDLGKESLHFFSESGKYLRSIPWNLNGFAFSASGALLELEHDDKKGYRLVERAPTGGAAKERFAIGLPDRERAAVVGEDGQGRIVVSLSESGKDEVEFSVWSPDGKRVSAFAAPRSGEIRQCRVIPMGRIFCMRYDPFAAPKGSVEFLLQ